MSGRIAAMLVSSALLMACNPPATARPREGAPVVVVSKTTRIDIGAVQPPTLAPATAVVVTPAPGDSQASTPPPTMALTHTIAATGGAAVNMRAGPSMTAPVVTTLREGALVEAVGDPVTVEGRQWQAIHTGDREGWVVAVVVRQR